MGAASLIISILVLLFFLGNFLRQRAQRRFQEAEEQRLQELQRQTEDNWQKGLARHRATTIGNLPPMPPSQSDPESKP